ncbi:hypothetical protein FH972_021408 [Carpinus fangiana]|uniref:N-acetyltransferase domain-containing protein n=1 Tax=Carpinus fangiana TaxID=176857 RepID=A0A5N6KPL8_9ROSI|nr:hypothetical protein FH972_021408 [Carpinus fangiana]
MPSSSNEQDGGVATRTSLTRAPEYAKQFDFVPINLESQEEIDLLIHQRTLCGWDNSMEDIKTWHKLVREGKKDFWWITLPAAEADKPSTKPAVHTDNVPAASKAIDGSAATVRAGHIGLKALDAYPDRSVMALKTFFIMPEHRSGGLGRACVAEVEARARAIPACKVIDIDTLSRRYYEDDGPEWRGRLAAVGVVYPRGSSNEDWYERLGYVKYKDEPFYPMDDKWPERLLSARMQKQLNSGFVLYMPIGRMCIGAAKRTLTSREKKSQHPAPAPPQVSTNAAQITVHNPLRPPNYTYPTYTSPSQSLTPPTLNSLPDSNQPPTPPKEPSNKPTPSTKATPTQQTMPPPAPKRRKLDPRKHALEEVTFDPAARAEYLTGFQKRKQQRAKAAQETAARKAREQAIADRRALREQRRVDLENHVRQVKEMMERAEEGVGGSGAEGEEEDEGWGGVESGGEGGEGQEEGDEDEVEYIDEDKFTTVTVRPLEGSDGEDDGGGGGAEAAQNGHQDEAKTGKKRVWTHDKPKGIDKKKTLKKKKKAFRYEAPAERKAARGKQAKRNSEAARERKGAKGGKGGRR